MAERTVEQVGAPQPEAAPPARRRTRALIVALWAAVLVAVPVVVVVVGHTHRTGQAASPPSSATASDLPRQSGIPANVATDTAHYMGLSPVPVTAAPDFTLVDQDGHTLSLSSLKGKAVVLTFMDPHCVDICPIVSQEFLDAYRTLGPSAANVVFVAVNVNSFHATVADVAGFSAAHRLSTIPSWHFVTGSVAAMQKVWDAYHVTVAAKTADADIVHTSIIYFIDPQGRERFVAAPAVDYTSDGTAYLPTNEISAWGQGIAQLSQDLT
jgi:cytochrome oxidase Cu insertion factor (SCO1/SenC/PrrC family)